VAVAARSRGSGHAVDNAAREHRQRRPNHRASTSDPGRPWRLRWHSYSTLRLGHTLPSFECRLWCLIGEDWHSARHRLRPRWRLHVNLPPIGKKDQRETLPEALHSVPLRWGGPYPTSLHILHRVSLDISPPLQTETFERLTNHEVHSGLWCSCVDETVLAAVKEALRNGSANASDFGAYVGMFLMEPGRLENYMLMNHWIIARPKKRCDGQPSWNIPPEGWGTAAWSDSGRWLDDRQWAPWRAVLTELGEGFSPWATVDWGKVQ